MTWLAEFYFVCGKCPLDVCTGQWSRCSTAESKPRH